MITIDTDQPKSELEEDRFQRYDFAGRIAKIIAEGNPIKSLVIGIYGKWGEGKTSVMNFIKKQLPDGTVIVNFNPWLFSNEEQLMRSFFSSLAYELDSSLESKKEKVGKVLSDYSEAIGSVTSVLGFSFKGFKEIGNRLQKTSIEKLKTRVDDIIQKSGKKIVVCIDDIDRLDVNEIQHIFKLIKLVGDFPATSYILAFDDEMVASALAPRYGDKQHANGYTFLEKIIQLPLKIPKASRRALKKYILDMVSQVVQGLGIVVTQEEVDKFRSVFDECYVPHIDNPRLASRFANAIHFALPLLHGEVNTNELILLEGLKVLFPTAYDFTRNNSILFLTDTSSDLGTKKLNRDELLKQVNTFLQNLTEADNKAIKEIWKQLFPQYKLATGGMRYRDDKWKDWYKQKRVCSGAYFERYFSYVVQTGDISDVLFQGLLTDLENLSMEQCQEKLDVLFSQYSVSDIVFKLRLWEDGLNETQSKNLAMLLAVKGEELPMEAGEFASFTTNAEGAKTIASLMLNIPLDQRKEQIDKLFEAAKNLEFAMEIFYWFIYKKQKSSEVILEDHDQHDLELKLVEYFKEELKTKPFFDIITDGETARLLAWWNQINPAELQTALELAIDGKAEKVIRLIQVFTPTIMSFGGSEPKKFKSGFDFKRYQAMKEIIDVTFAYTILYESNIERETFDLTKIPDRDALSDSQLINIFMQFFEQDLANN